LLTIGGLDILLIFTELVAHYPANHSDYGKSKEALATVTEVLGELRSIVAELENTEKLIELQEDIGGLENLVHQGRVSFREL